MHEQFGTYGAWLIPHWATPPVRLRTPTRRAGLSDDLGGNRCRPRGRHGPARADDRRDGACDHRERHHQHVARRPAARKVGRPAVQNPYLGLRNYTNNLLRHGFTEADVDGSGSDALIDALVAHGSAETIYTQIDEHLTAGANHVGIQVFTDDPSASPVPAFRALAEHCSAP